MSSANTSCKVDKVWLRELVAKGFTDREIGKLMGVSRGRIHQLRHALGLPLSKDVRDAKLKQLLESGMAQTEAAIWMGCSEDVVNHSAKRQGLSVSLNIRTQRKEARREQVRQCVVGGMTLDEMAVILHVSRRSLNGDLAALRSRGYELAPRHNNQCLEEWLARNKKVLAGVAAGKSAQELARELATTPHHLARLRAMLTASKNGER